MGRVLRHNGGYTIIDLSRQGPALFFTHLRTIVRAARNFKGTAWAIYDMVHRRQLANRGSLDWGVVDHTTYSEAFTGRAHLIPRCSYCLADTHTAQEYSYALAAADVPATTSGSVTPQDMGQSRAPAHPLQPTQQGLPRTPAVDEICRSFNMNSCRFPRCRYAQLCSCCRLLHPVTECNERRRTGDRSRSPPLPPHA